MSWCKSQQFHRPAPRPGSESFAPTLLRLSFSCYIDIESRRADPILQLQPGFSNTLSPEPFSSWCRATRAHSAASVFFVACHTTQGAHMERISALNVAKYTAQTQPKSSGESFQITTNQLVFRTARHACAIAAPRSASRSKVISRSARSNALSSSSARRCAVCSWSSSTMLGGRGANAPAPIVLTLLLLLLLLLALESVEPPAELLRKLPPSEGFLGPSPADVLAPAVPPPPVALIAVPPPPGALPAVSPPLFFRAAGTTPM